MEQIGARPADRVAALREVVSATRALLHGDTVDCSGTFVRLSHVRLEHPPRHAPPVLIGTTGERGIGVAREVADGVLLPEGTGERALAWCARRLGGHGSITTYAWLRVDEDPDDARARMVPVARDWLATGLYPNLIAHGAVDADDPEAAVDRIAIAR